MRKNTVCVIQNSEFGDSLVSSRGVVEPFEFPPPEYMVMARADAMRLHNAFTPKNTDMKQELILMELIPPRRGYLRPLPAPQLESVK